MSRRAAPGGTGQLCRYIFRYIFAKEGVNKHISKEKLAPIPDKLYVHNVRLYPRDIKHIRSEIDDKMLLTDIREKGLTKDTVAYIQKYLIEKGRSDRTETKAQNEKPFILRHGITGRSLNSIIRQFEEQDKNKNYNRSDAVSIHHTVISFGAGDKEKITDDILRDIFNKYVEIRGTDILYCGTKHIDKNHIHLHLAMSSSRADGSSVSLSKKNFADVKEKLQLFQASKYPFLLHSLPEHGAKIKARERGEFENFKRNERSSIKNDLQKCLDESYAAAISTDDFIAKLKSHNIETYTRKGNVTGAVFQGYKFKFSKNGIDIAKLAERDAIKKKEMQQLKMLQNLRSGKSRDKIEKSLDNRKDQMREAIRAAEGNESLTEVVPEMRISSEKELLLVGEIQQVQSNIENENSLEPVPQDTAHQDENIHEGGDGDSDDEESGTSQEQEYEQDMER